MANLEVGEIVMCTVDRIAGTIVFVDIEENGQGSIILSEIAPGRIRNLREYVVPKKKIICKVLRVTHNGNIELSLRRVTKKETKEIKEQYKKEKSCINILKGILGDKSEKVINEILKTSKVDEFIQNAKENPKDFEKIIGKTEAKKILEILIAQKQKKVCVKKEIKFVTTKPNGLKLIKECLGKFKDIEVNYLSAGKYTFKAEADDLKKADNKLKEVLQEIEKKAKKLDFNFSIKEK